MKVVFLINLMILFGLLQTDPVMAAVVDKYQTVSLDAFILAQQPPEEGKRFIVKPKGISFQAELMSSPESRKIEYAYTALMMINVNPLPSITHRMFIRSAAGKVISVYVTEEGAKQIQRQLKIGEKVIFSGYHIYNYRLGPAIVVEGFTK
jgi:hypothetical protein